MYHCEFIIFYFQLLQIITIYSDLKSIKIWHSFSYFQKKAICFKTIFVPLCFNKKGQKGENKSLNYYIAKWLDFQYISFGKRNRFFFQILSNESHETGIRHIALEIVLQIAKFLQQAAKSIHKASSIQDVFTKRCSLQEICTS